LLAALAVMIMGATASSAGAALSVSVGYADTLRANPNFPTPWAGAPNTTFIGSGSPWDAGAVRIVNDSTSPVTVGGVTVDLHHGAGGASGPTFNLWGAFTIPGAVGSTPGQVILTQTTQYNFDTSDFPVNPCGTKLSSTDPRIPTVALSTGTGTVTLKDSGHVLDTFGYDLACQHNETTQWTQIGSDPCPSSALSLAPPSQTKGVGQTATVTATLTNAGGPGCGTPLPGVKVDFTGSGPNAPISGSGTTNGSGQATFSYSGGHTGTDTLAASVTNAEGGVVNSNTVTVTWGTLVRDGGFSCRASALLLNITGIAKFEPVVANNADNPCKTASATALPLTIGSTKAGVLSASTTLNTPSALPAAGDSASASATAASVLTGLVPGHSISSSTLKSNASVTCRAAAGGGLAATFAGSSSVDTLTIDGKTIVVGGAPLTLAVGPLATLYINRQIVASGVLLQRAFELDISGIVRLVIAESKVDTTRAPCATVIKLP
jgi:hypothetical protein